MTIGAKQSWGQSLQKIIAKAQTVSTIKAILRKHMLTADRVVGGRCNRHHQPSQASSR